MAVKSVLERDKKDASPEPEPRRSRWRFWVSPADQPAWARPALLAVTAVAVLLYAWSLPANGFAPYYSSGVLSMAGSWEAFFFGAFDPNATIMMDKLPGGFIPQAVAVWLFGPYPWAMALPQVIYGAISVLVMYRVVRLWMGPRAGLLAAAIFAATPLLVSMFGHPMVDGALTVCLVLAADACQRAVHTGRMRWLLLAGVWIGLGFQAKMMQAWMVLPALGIAYLIAARGPVLRRFGHLAAALGVTLVVSFSWTAAMSLAPADSRPYADGTTNDNVWTMVVGYNGVERFGIHLPGTVVLSDNDTGGDEGGDEGGGGGMPPEIGQLYLLRYLTQIAWMLPLTLAGLAYGLARWRRQDRVANGGFAMWSAWLAINIAVYSVIEILHTAYLATFIPAVAALSAGGAAIMWRAYRERRRGSRWVLPVVVAVQGAFAAVLADAADFMPWLAPSIAVLTVGSVLALVVRSSPRVQQGAMAAGLAAALLAPAAWSASVLDHRYGGSSFDAEAGPIGPRLNQMLNDMMGDRADPGAVAAITEVPATLTDRQRHILDHVETNNEDARYPFVTDSWVVASRYIVATGTSPLAMAGFQGASPFPTLAEAQRLVDTGEARFFLLTGETGWLGNRSSDETAAIRDWVTTTCQEVSPSTYLPPGTQEAPADPTTNATLHRCT
ncbi:ArnT family glycosyltransferase [Actinophytocola gossypii]|uniref:Glycosyltransferase family 39 protein n=1 Tax=Actinophytocola gossypii TaxID=2812003 RepID=A0ABT2JEP1_9PSEU|nr:glycosyltransferase family 39 protein [Actinophytocola gossypii]MCT2586341.1 glycosyltransferase family 39 protein [Actinophytocola gossypii]